MKESRAPSGAAPESASPSVTPVSLLERLRARDAAAWQRVIQLYGPLVNFWCRRAGLHAQDAEDVAQEVFAAAAAGLDRFHRDRPGDTFRGWLRGITRNQVLLHFRRRHNQPQAEGGSAAWQNLQEVSDPLAQPDDEERAAIEQIYLRALDQVRGQFEPATWQAFWLTAVDGRTPTELAAELGMTAASVRQAKSRVLRRLKQELGELLE
jgi:RNA polymerase sigma-70 factor (ECF subfamily)